MGKYSLMLIQILKSHSSPSKTLSVEEIQGFLREEYGIDAQRKGTITKNMEDLLYLYGDSGPYSNGEFYIKDLFQEEFDAGIRKAGAHHYYIERVDLTNEDIEVIYHAVSESKSFTEKTSNRICKQLEKRMLKEDMRSFKAVTYSDGKMRTSNDEVIHHVSTIRHCIGNDECIRFKYAHYNMKKKLEIKKPEKWMEMKPKGIVFSSGYYYLVAMSLRFKDFNMFRIDKMMQVEKLESDIDISAAFNQKIDISKFVLMHTDELVDVRLRCDKQILDNVIDQFEDCRLSNDYESDDYFIVRLPSVSKLGAKYWALQFSMFCEVLAPNYFREEVKGSLEKAVSKYQ